ncbi:MAG: deoxyribonuclease IV [Promethearchaeota archaeon]
MGLLGCHVSVHKGVQFAPERGHELGCEVIQIFTRSPSQWKCKPLTEENITEWKAAIQTYNIQAVMTHAIYLINMASTNRTIRKKSETAFLNEMDRCEALDIPYLVFHPGSYRGSTEKSGIRYIVSSLQKLLLKRPDQKLQLLIENTAGGGFLLGNSFEQISDIMDKSDFPERIHACFDTSHAFAAGYDLQTPEGYHEIMDQFDSVIGLEHLKGFHLNDSQVELGSHIDRHENIGDGFIGKAVFKEIVNDQRFKSHPMTLETPGGEEAFRTNLQLLYKLRTG